MVVLRQLLDCMGGVMVKMFSPSAIDHGFEPRAGQTIDNKIGICRFSAKHPALRSKNKNCLARNHDVSEWSMACLSMDCCFRPLAL